MDAPHGVISLGTAPPASGPSILTELRIEGVHFAFLTFTNDKGDTEQQLAPVPYSKEFYSKEGQIIGMVAQKTQVTRLDPVRRGGLETLDDGTTGEMRVTIRVSGQPIGSARTEDPFGITSTTVTIP